MKMSFENENRAEKLRKKHIVNAERKGNARGFNIIVEFFIF